MKKIDYQEFQKNYSLLDSKLLSIKIFEIGSILSLEVFIKLKNNEKVKFIFKDLVEYSFYYIHSTYFYTISDYILTIDENNFYYVSFDPFDANNGINVEDSDIVRSKKIFIEIG